MSKPDSFPKDIIAKNKAEDKNKKDNDLPKKLICKLERAEVDGLIMAKKRGAYMEWAYAICAKYNLTRTNFIVDEDTCELFYPIST